MKVNSQKVKARREQTGHQSNPPTLQMGKLRLGEVNNLLVFASQFFLLYVLPPPPYPVFLSGSRAPAPLASEGLHHSGTPDPSQPGPPAGGWALPSTVLWRQGCILGPKHQTLYLNREKSGKVGRREVLRTI